MLLFLRRVRSKFVGGIVIGNAGVVAVRAERGDSRTFVGIPIVMVGADEDILRRAVLEVEDRDEGMLAAAERIVSKGETFTREYPADRAGLLFIREGAIIPSQGDVSYLGTRPFDKVTLNIYPHGDSEFTLMDDDGESIFTRKKPLCEKTLERIYAGLVKFVAGGKKQHEDFMMRYNTMRAQDTVKSMEDPCPTVTTKDRFAKVKCQFLSKQFSGDPSGKNIDIEQPAGTITCKDHHAFVTAYYGNGFNTSIDEPCPTVTTKDRMSLVTTQFLDNQYGNSKPSGINVPSPTVVNNPKQSLVTTHYLMNPQFASSGGSIDKPCFTLIARMDKMPPYLITTKEGALGIAIYDDDSEWTRKIKEFMAAYGIVDICMRMLNIGELKRIMGFPTDYVLVGTQAEQKKYIGNAVEVNMSRVLCEALSRRLIENDKQHETTSF